jgi:hypothetical protein
MKNLITLAPLITAIFTLLGSPRATADDGGDIPWVLGVPLDYWRFDTSLSSARGHLPIAAHNVQIVPALEGTALQVDSSSPALLQYGEIEPTNHILNMTCDEGTFIVDFMPSWNGTNLGGTGPQSWARLFEVGEWSTNASGWISLFLSPSGAHLHFSAQSGGIQTNYLAAKVSLSSNQFYQIALTYSSRGSALYLNGRFLTNGPGVTLLPDAPTRAHGFRIGSDTQGLSQVKGLFRNLATFFYAMRASEVAEIYLNTRLQTDPLGALGDGPLTSTPGEDPPPDPGGGGEDGDDPGVPQEEWRSYPTNALVIEITKVNNGLANLILHGTVPDNTYELLSKSALSNGLPWASEGTVLGAANQDWTPATVVVGTRTNKLFIWCRSWIDSDGDGLPDWWELANSLDPNSADTGNTGIPDGYKNPAGDGWNNLYKYEHGMVLGQFYTPPPPRMVVTRVDATGTNVVITWVSGGGPVTNYVIEAGWYGDDSSWFSPIGHVGSSTLTFTAHSTYPLTGTTYQQPAYQIRAYFSNGSNAVSQSVPAFMSGVTLTAEIIRGPGGHYHLAVPALPSSVTDLRVIAEEQDWPSIDIPATNFVNGMAPLTDAQIQMLKPYIVIGLQVSIASGAVGNPTFVQRQSAEESGPAPLTFVNAMRHVKENLRFLLRSATVSHPFSYASGLSMTDPPTYPFAGGTNAPHIWYARGATSTNYEYYGRHAFSPSLGYAFMDELRPVQDNFLWSNFVFNAQADGSPGAYSYTFCGNGSGPYLRTLYDEPSVYGGSGMESNLPVALVVSNATWIFSGEVSNTPDANDDCANADVGLSVTSSTNLLLSVGVKNCFGLPIKSVKVGRGNAGASQSLQQGIPGSFSAFEAAEYFPEVAEPALQTVDYYFASQSPHFNYGTPLTPLPGTPDFTITNTSPVLLTAVGQFMAVAGWAKQQITNGYPNKFAYLEQYFDKAYKLGTNGIATTNQTGVLSPYGEFFPTEPGPVALVTMPDIDTGERGTGIVNVIKLQLDVNHDGVMDLTFGGPDNTSAENPFVFWLNNDHDERGATNQLDKDLKVKPAQGNLLDYSYGNIRCQRNLEDFARLWIRGLPLLPPSSGYTAKLSLRNTHGSPKINLYYAYDPLGSTNYLFDTNAAAAQFIKQYLGEQLKVDYARSVGSVSASSNYTFLSGRFQASSSSRIFCSREPARAPANWCSQFSKAQMCWRRVLRGLN